MSRSTAAVFPGRNGHNEDRYEEEEKELSAAQIAEHARIRASINARLAALQAETKSKKGTAAVRGPRIPSNLVPRMTKKQKQIAALAKRRATLAAKTVAVEEDEEEEDEEDVEVEGGAGSGSAAAAAVPMTSANYVAAAAARYAASGLPAVAASKKGSVRFFNMANMRNVNHRDSRVLISDRATRKSTTRKPVVPDVNIRRSRHAGNVAALFAKMSSWAVTREPDYLSRVLSHIKTEPHYLDAHLTAKEKEVLATPGTLAKLERQAALVNKE
jgi:hypothetical protein